MEPANRAAESPPAYAQTYAKHPLAARLLHWANLIVIAVLVWTAFLLLSGSPELSWSHWLSPGVYAALHLNDRNDEGRVWHVLFSFLMIAVGALYGLYLMRSGRWKDLVPNAASWKDAYLVVLHDVGGKTHRSALAKYNGAQRIAYCAVVLLGLGEVITGLPIYFKDWTGYANILGGQTAIRFEHFILMLGILAFVVVHLIQVARAGWNNFRAMIIGLEVVYAKNDNRTDIARAQPESENLAPLAPAIEIEADIRERSRRGFLCAAVVGAVVLFAGLFAHEQSGAPDRVPSWLNWARDVESSPNESTDAQR
ncbi:MAG TPA: cytochrome b/b6 domain-containing protein [Candidatus Baltobacteraceae bacterium]